MSRAPTLADRAMQLEQRMHHRSTVERVTSQIRAARKFVLDDDATRHLGEVIREVPDLLFRESRFARAPFPLTWIEMPFPPLWKALNVGEPANDCDLHYGFLIDHDEVYGFSAGTIENPNFSAIMMPFSYLLHTPWTDESRDAFAKATATSDIELDAFLWGSTFNSIGGFSLDVMNDPDHPQSILRRSHSVRLLPTRKEFMPKSLRTMVAGMVGDMKNIIAMLLLLNRPSLTQYREVPRATGLLRGKRQVYFAHNIVTIPIDPKPTLRLIGTAAGEGVSKRRHEVRGHWVHNLDAREYGRIGCVHNWQPDTRYEADDPNDPDHFQCTFCEGKKWWRIDHTRGNAIEGYVQKEYRVTD